MGDKKLYKISDVKYIQVPLLDELSVDNMKKLIDKDKEVYKCFPDEYLKKKAPDRAYFYNIINTVHHGFLDQIIGHAQRERANKVMKEEEEQVILANDEWMANLSALPFYSKVSFIKVTLIQFNRKMVEPYIC